MMKQSMQMLKKWDKVREQNKYPLNTFLRQWIVNKIDTYQEPTRKDRLPSDPVGFSTVKYLSAIFLGTMIYTVKQVAEFLDVSYHTARRQHVADDFIEKMTEARQDFAQDLGQYIKKNLLQVPPDNYPIAKFKDFQYLNDETLKTLLHSLYSEEREAERRAGIQIINFLILKTLPKKRMHTMAQYHVEQRIKTVVNKFVRNDKELISDAIRAYRENPQGLENVPQLVGEFFKLVKDYMELSEKGK